MLSPLRHPCSAFFTTNTVVYKLNSSLSFPSQVSKTSEKPKDAESSSGISESDEEEDDDEDEDQHKKKNDKTSVAKEEKKKEVTKKTGS